MLNRVVIYRPSIFRAQLKAEAERFCDTNIHIKKKAITIPRGLVWYAADFGKSEKDIVLYIYENLPDTALSKFLASQGQMVSPFSVSSFHSSFQAQRLCP